MDTEVRQLRRVRWGVRGTLALGISASFAANVLHAHHVLIDQIIAGWPPVAVFATIEAIARVPVRRRWLAGIRLTGLGFVAGIAFWVSYWHMASVAAAHGENGSKYLLPLSVDGLVVVASISLVELTGQISAAQTAARATTADSAGASAAATTAPARFATLLAPVVAPATNGVPVPARPVMSPAVAVPRPVPAADAAMAATTASAATRDGPDSAEDRDAGLDTVTVTARSPQPTVPAPAAAEPATRTASGPRAAAGETPPTNTADAVAYWRAKDPHMPVRDICARVGRSERTVRRILDGLPPLPAPVDQHASHGIAAADGHRPGINGATLSTLANQATSG